MFILNVESSMVNYFCLWILVGKVNTCLLDSKSLLIFVSREQIIFRSNFTNWMTRPRSLKNLRGTRYKFWFPMYVRNFVILSDKFSSVLLAGTQLLLDLLSNVAGKTTYSLEKIFFPNVFKVFLFVFFFVHIF